MAASSVPAAPAAASMVEPLPEGLTAEQRAVVCHGRGPLLVVAGPGAGKTRVLIHRIAWLLRTGAAQPWEVLAVTFSVRAADELQLRLREMLGVRLASGVRAATFHALCAGILREHAYLAGRNPGWTIYDQQEVRRTIDWLLSDRRRGEVLGTEHGSRLASAEIQREVSIAKNRLLDPDAYEKAAGHAAAALIAAVWRELEVEMRALNAVDFDDLIVCTVRLLSEHPHVLRTVRERIRYQLVDEVQDTCPAQLELATLLAGGQGNVCCVGDPDQVIYGFRQADPQGMRRLAARLPGHRRVLLRQNFRSRAEILRAACGCVGHNTLRERWALIAVRGGGGVVHTVAFETEREEAEWAAASVASALVEGLPASEVLILARTGYATQPAQVELARNGIAHRVLGSLGLYERAEVRDGLAYLALLANPRDARAFARAIAAPRRGIGAAAQGVIVTLARERHNGDMIAACADPAALAGIRSEQARGQLTQFAGGVGHARAALAAGRSLAHVAVAALTMPGGIVRFHQRVRDHAGSAYRRRDAERVLEDLRSLCRHVQSYETSEQHATVAGFLEHAAGLHSREITREEDHGRVTISTIHRCKGAEARLVILLGCEERLLPIHHSLETGDAAPLEEERRLFYVACTRAKDSLYVSWCARRGGRTTGGPSRFLGEAGLIESDRTANSQR